MLALWFCFLHSEQTCWNLFALGKLRKEEVIYQKRPGEDYIPAVWSRVWASASSFSGLKVYPGEDSGC